MAAHQFITPCQAGIGATIQNVTNGASYKVISLSSRTAELRNIRTNQFTYCNTNEDSLFIQIGWAKAAPPPQKLSQMTLF